MNFCFHSHLDVWARSQRALDVVVFVDDDTHAASLLENMKREVRAPGWKLFIGRLFAKYLPCAVVIESSLMKITLLAELEIVCEKAGYENLPAIKIERKCC